LSVADRFQAGNGKGSRLRRGDAGRTSQLHADATVTFGSRTTLTSLPMTSASSPRSARWCSRSPPTTCRPRRRRCCAAVAPPES